MRIKRNLFFTLLSILSILSPAISNPFYSLYEIKGGFVNWVDPLIEQRGTSTSATTNNQNLVITKPAGIAVGDVMIVNISLSRSNNTADNPTASGWTLVGGALLDNNKNYRGAVLYRIADATDVSALGYTFALGAGTTGGVGAIVAFANVDVSGASPFDVAPGSINVSPVTKTFSVVANGITTSSGNAALLMLAQSNDNVTWDNTLNGANAWRSTNPTVLNELYDIPYIGSSDKLSVGMAWSLKNVAGQTGNGLVNQSAQKNFGAILLALKPINTVVPSPSITSTLTASSEYGSSSSYQITASYSPTSFSAATLPTGMSLDAATGLIGVGVNTPAGNYSISLTATNASGTGTASTLNYTVTSKALTISANSILKCSGVEHVFNTALFSSTGLVAGETISSVVMSSSGSTSTAAVGDYAIQTSNATGTNGFLASNYQITYQSTGLLTVRPTNSWHGTANTTWTNTANWCLSGSQIPGTSGAAIIYPSANNPELGDSYTLLDLTINNGASILLKGANTNLTLLGSLVNDGALNMQATTRVTFGTGAHTIGGTAATTFLNLTVNAGRDINMSQNISVSNQLVLTSGYLVPATGMIVTLNNGATVSGVSSNSYVKGAFKKIGTNGNANYAFDFPIGKISSAVYDPVRITFPNASIAEEVTVSYEGSAYNTTAKNANIREVAPEYWNITPGTLTENAAGLHVKLHYKGTGGASYFTNATNVSYYKVGHFNGTTWEVAVGLDAAQNSADAGATLAEGFASANGVTAFSRFTMLEIVASVLPVHLTHFNAKPIPGNRVQLSWTTAQEQQNKGFRIERASLSSQGKFTRIGYVYSQGVNGFSSVSKHYIFTESVPQGERYANYRIVQEDLDGRLSISDIKLVKFNSNTAIQIGVEPTEGKITIYRDPNARKMNYLVTDQLGRIIKQGLGIVDQTVTLYLQGNGFYNLHLQIPETGEQLIKRVLVQK